MGRELKKSMSQKLRMDGRDYSLPGWYFLTLGADYHKHLFGPVERGEMKLNELGKLVEKCWVEIPEHYDHVELGAWQVMPNHFHGLVRIVRSGGKGLGEVVNMFKGSVTREWRRAQGCYGVSRHGGKERGDGEKERVWAPNYYDVICFDAEELTVREKYVRANPRRWALRDVPSGRFNGGVYKGNLSLLKTDAPKRGLRVSRRVADSEIEEIQREMATFEGIVLSTFFSPGERVCLKKALCGRAGVVWVSPMVLPERIPERWADAFFEKRALWLSFSDVSEATRLGCDEANRIVKELAGGQ